MDKSSQQLFDCYEQLISIQRTQLSIALRDRYDGQIEDIKELESQKLSPQATINGIRLNDQLYNEIAGNYHVEVSAYIQELQSTNHQLQRLLNEWYGEASSQMQQVSVHRKTLQTYGGVNYSDVISYYIDDRK